MRAPPPAFAASREQRRQEAVCLASVWRAPLLPRAAAAGVPGFQVNRTRGDKVGRKEAEALDAPMKDTMFFWDKVHPSECSLPHERVLAGSGTSCRG